MDNKQAEKEIAEEKAKFGFNRPAARASGSDTEVEEDEEVDNLEDTEVEDEVDSETEEDELDESEDSEEDSDEDETDEDEDTSSSKKVKKGVPFKVHNELRKELGETKRLLGEALENNKNLEAKLPDNFQERLDSLTKEIGVEDPEGLKKIIKFIEEVTVGKNLKNLEAKISVLEKQVKDNKVSTVVDEFPKEWESFETKFSKEYPNATAEQIKSARSLMDKLSHDKKIGGKVYKHAETGEEVMDPYPLDYIYFKHKDQFEGLVTGKKSKGLETTRGGRITTTRQEQNADDLHVPKNASAATIREKDKKYSRLEADGTDRFNSPVGSI